MNKHMKPVLITLGVVAAIVIFFVSSFAGVNNRAISIEEQVKTSQSAITVQEKRRTDLIVQLVDAIKSYNKFEQNTLTQVMEARSKATGGNVEEAGLIIQAVVEAYPELKSQNNYKHYMTETSITENLIATHRQAYNDHVKEYNRYTKKFPNNIILNIFGYDKQNFPYLNYENNEDAPKNLWDE